MGYTANFKGTLKFTSEPTGPQLAHLNRILGQDIRDLDWVEKQGDDYWYHFDLELTPDFDGVRWSGAEKTYGMVEVVNTVLYEMRKKWPDFGLSGRLDAQGEEVGDVWALEVSEGGLARKIEYRLEGREVECPHCEETFILDGNLVEVGVS